MLVRRREDACRVEVVFRAGIDDCESDMALQLIAGTQESSKIRDNKFGDFGCDRLCEWGEEKGQGGEEVDSHYFELGA